MVIFHGYVKLPEGSIRNGDFPWGFLTRNFFDGHVATQWTLNGVYWV
jgi:hypothetical protein